MKIRNLLLIVAGVTAVVWAFFALSGANEALAGRQTAAATATEAAIYLPALLKPEPTPTATATATATATQAATATATATATAVSSATPTATATATPAGTTLLEIANGDFEQGATGWVEYRSLADRPLIVQNAPGLPVSPRSGQWFAWLGADHLLGETNNHQSRIVHLDTFNLPAGGPIYLHLYYQIISEEVANPHGVCDYDVVNLWINNVLMQQGQLCQLTNTDGWTPTAVDLSVFAGQTVSLEFEVRTDSERISHFFLDDLSFRSAP